MPIETSTNELDGITYAVPPGESLAGLPAGIARHVDAFDRDLFLDPEDHAADLIEGFAYGPIRSWFEALSHSYFHRLLIHSADAGPEGVVGLREVYFQFFNRRLERFFNVQFRKSAEFDVIDPALGPIFNRVACIDPSTWMIAGGQLRYDPSEAGLFAAMGWIEPQDKAEAARIRRLYTSFSGDEIGCRTDGMAIWCEHGRLEAIGPIGDFLDLYFEILLARDEDTFGDIAYAEKLVATLKQRQAAR